MRLTQFCTGLVVLAALSGLPSDAQTTVATYKSVSSPYGDEHPYRIGSSLTPAVDIDGLKWHIMRVDPRSEARLEPGTTVPITVGLEFENTSGSNLRSTVVVLFENASGGSLERIECAAFKIGAGDTKTSNQKFKVAAETLLETRKIYLFCDVK